MDEFPVSLALLQISEFMLLKLIRFVQRLSFRTKTEDLSILLGMLTCFRTIPDFLAFSFIKLVLPRSWNVLMERAVRPGKHSKAAIERAFLFLMARSKTTTTLSAYVLIHHCAGLPWFAADLTVGAQRL